MKTLALAALLALTHPAPAPAAGPIEGRWLLDFDSDTQRGDGRAQLTLKRSHARGSWTNSNPIALSELRGLSRPAGSADVPARFALVRDAGTISFEGQLDAAGGEGRFSFAPAPGFAAALGTDDPGPLSDDQVFAAAVHDVSRPFVAELRALGYDRLRFDNLIAMRIHGATPEYIRELKALGYDRVPPEKLVAMRIHGVTAESIRDLKSLGYDGIPAEQLVAMRIHGATPEYIRELKALGYDHVPVEQLVAMRIHGASPEYVRELKELGYDHVPPEQLVAMRIHGVSPEYVRGLAELGYRRVPVEELVAMRIHGVSLEFVKKMQQADPGLSSEELVNRRIHSH